MSTNDIDADSIGPDVDLERVPLPDRVGQRMQTLYGSDAPPSTVAEWVEQMEAAIIRERDRKPTIEDLCTTDEGDHTFEAANGDHCAEYICVLDPIAYPYITDRPGRITSTTPVRGRTVTVDVDEHGVESSHERAVVSLGASDHVDQVDSVTLEAVYKQVCGYVQTFVDEAEYEEWAETVDAATTSVPLATGIGAAGTIATTLFEEE